MLLFALQLVPPAAFDAGSIEDLVGDRVEDALPPAWGAVDARYVVTVPADGPLQLELTWHFSASRPGYDDIRLTGPGLVVASVEGPATTTPDGLHVLLGPDATSRTVTVRGTLAPSAPGAASLPILAAARQQVTVRGQGLDISVAGATDGWLAAADRLDLTWKPHADRTPTPPRALVHAESAAAVWAEPNALLTRAEVRWKVLRGEVERFELDVTGLDEVDVTGPNLASTTREGSRLVLTPRAPVRGTFAVTVRARRAASGDGDVPVPAPRPIAARVERYWTVGRAEEGELVPVGGPNAVSAQTLPEWARGLSETPTESYWQGDTPLRVRLAHYAPIMGPDTVIERATLVVAAAREGRSLVRTTWDVRNERRQYLHVSPPPGVRPITARVSGEPVLVLSDGAGGIYVPLEKSVETVQGLLTFPVEVTWIGEGGAWARKGERDLVLPAVDAPIQAANWEVYLPRGLTSPDAHPAPIALLPDEPEAGADELQNAVSAYKRNDFSSSQHWLQQARASGSTSANVDRLQSNLDVLFEDDDSTVEDVGSRRVRELANARTVDMQVEQEKIEEAAKRAYASGEVDEAERYLEQVIALSKDIGVTEQKESAEQSGKRDEAVALLTEVKKQKAAAASTSNTKRLPAQKNAPKPDSDADGILDIADNWDGDEALDEAASPEPSPETSTEPPPPTVTATTTPVSQTFSMAMPGRGRAPGTKGGGKVDTGSRDTVADNEVRATDERTRGPVYTQDKTEIDFEGLDIEGELVKPSGALLLDRKKAAMNPLIQVRAGFDDDQSGAFAFGEEAEEEEPEGGEFDARPEAPPPPPPRPPDVAADRNAPKSAEDKPAEPPAEPAFGPERRAALQVKAAPLTLAMPLGGEVVRETAALLPAGASPTLTVRYRTPPGADR